MSAGVRGRWALAATTGLLLGLMPATALAANPSLEDFTPPDDSIAKTTKFEGCIQNGTFTLPTDFGGSVGDKFACPDDSGNDSDYTPGSLTGWNELDYVPFFLRMENTSNAPTTFNMIIAADNDFKGTPGYSDISVPEIFRTSAAGCAVSSGPVGTTDKITGGADTSIYRVLTLTLPAKGTCQVEWYNTIALGASGIPGKSLQAYVFDQDDFKGGKRTISLGVDISQQLSKTMSAVQGSNHTWTVSKKATPSTVTLDTCEPDGAQADVDVQVTWTKQAATPGDVTITTTITAKNAAARPVAVQVNDKIYQGTGTTTLIDDWTSGVVTVPAKGSYDFVHTYTWKQRPAGVTKVNDVATATYLDPEGDPYPGNTTAKATASIEDAPPTNASATVDDLEQLVGTPLPAGVTFASDSPSPIAGSFLNGYTAGTKTVGPVDWTSGSQKSSGSTTFPKTVYVEKGTVGAAQLVDTATLNGSDGLQTTANAAVDVIVQTNATLSIEKTIPDILTGDESATFTFDVLGKDGVVVADDVPITFTAGETQQSTSVGGLAPGMYTVQENTVPAGWDPPGQPQVVDLTGSTCAGTAPFANSVTPATATAVKTTQPAGSEAGWEMTLTPAGDGEPRTVVTDDSGQAPFGELAEGAYTITEAMQSGWEFAGQTGDCEFTVDYPRDAGKTFTCTLTNSRVPPPPPQAGSMTITKEFNAQSSGFTGTFEIGYACVQGTTAVKSGFVTLGNGQSETVTDLPVGTTCIVTEQTLPAPPTGWTFNQPTYVPASGEVTITTGGQTVDVRVINSISQVNPVVVKKVCPIEPVLVKKIKKDGNRVLIKKIKTNKNSCVLLKPVVLCKPLGSAAAGETAFCDTKVTKRGRVIVNTKGYDRVRVTVVVRSKPKPGFEDRWKPNTWRKSWILKG